VGGRRREQGLDALPQLVGQQAVGQGGHGPGSSHYPAHPRFRNVLLRLLAVNHGHSRHADLHRSSIGKRRHEW
jgi:hypothetical protein